MDGWAGLAVVTANVGLHAGRWAPRTTLFHTRGSKLEVESSIAQDAITGSVAQASASPKPLSMKDQSPFVFFVWKKRFRCTAWKKGFLCSFFHSSNIFAFLPLELAQRPEPGRHFCPESHPCTGAVKTANMSERLRSLVSAVITAIHKCRNAWR
jgi:hypothetical protein